MIQSSPRKAQSGLFAPAPRVSVLAPFPLAQAYTYALPEGMTAQPGDYVRVPLGRRETLGVVWDGAADEDVAEKKLKFVLERFDAPPMAADLRHFIDRMARYTLSSPGAILKMVLSVPAVFAPEKRKGRLKIEGADYRLDGKTTLSEAQTLAAQSLCAAVKKEKFATFLLDGVTGAGKTEVYLEAVQTALAAQKQALILLPEIALTAQFLKRFEARFGAPPAQWHSGMTPAQRRETWRGVMNGKIRVVAGARSALFLPFADLALIVADEEHDSSYKQEEGVIYSARDMAVLRASEADIPVVLVSATPSLETETNARQGRYTRLHLPDRHGGAAMPDVHVIDLKKDRPERQRFLSSSLREALKKTLEAGEQSLLFLNRRGYAPLTLCRTCGFRLQCPSCTAWLVEHKVRGKLQCHHCGFATPQPKECPSCNDHDSWASCGPGVERIAEELTEVLPDARLLVLSSDLTESAAAIADAVTRIENHEVDVIVGTQIVAKGHHFPELTCVGVVDADLGLSGGDLRAGERTFQLLHQVSGRAGRAQKPGNVYLQTFMPENKIMRALAANDRARFYDTEIDERERAGMPPFGRLAGVIVSGGDEEKLDDFCRTLARAAPQMEGVRILGPAPAPLAVIRNRHRRRFLIKTDKGVAIQKVVEIWLQAVKTPSSIDLRVDIDPQSFF